MEWRAIEQPESGSPMRATNDLEGSASDRETTSRPLSRRRSRSPQGNEAVRGQSIGGRRYEYYRCANKDRARFAGQAVCPNAGVPLAALDEAVWIDVRALLEDPEQLEREYIRRVDQGTTTTAADSVCRQQRLVKLKRAVERLIDLYANEEVLSKEQLTTRVSTLKSQIQRLQEEETATQQQRQDQAELRLAMGHLQAFRERLQDGLATIDWATRRRLIQTLVRQIEIHDDRIQIVYRVGPPSDQTFTKPPILQDCSTEHPPFWSKVDSHVNHPNVAKPPLWSAALFRRFFLPV